MSTAPQPPRTTTEWTQIRPERSARITFSCNPLDRRSEKREDASLLDEALVHPRARVLVFHGERLLVGEGPNETRDMSEARALGVDFGAALLLGWTPDGEPRFAARLEAEPSALPHGAAFIDLRTLAAEGRLDPDGFGPAAQARSMLGWHERHGFCANCGLVTKVAIGGYRRDCDGCGAQHFPRVDPVAIMFVSHGEHALLGRQARFKAGSYSCLAGFVEPGETLEDAVRREVFEEAGIRVGEVCYVASQPWPFVSTLMIGFRAEALTTDIVMDEAELEDCRWFHRDEVAAMVAGTHAGGLFCPPPLAIARHLVDDWLERG
jgi:NAD+ diphosphatase